MEQIVFITGASSGIGEALAIESATAGNNVVLIARREEQLEAVATRCREANSAVKVLYIVCDVTDLRLLEAAVDRVNRELGKIDTVIANAGALVTGRFEQLPISEYERLFATNVYGVLNTVKATIKNLKETQGRLGIVASMNSYIAMPTVSAYCMSKFAVRALAESLYSELARDNVSVTSICPGFVQSEIRRHAPGGGFDPAIKDEAPHWLQMNRFKAARQILRAVERRRREKIISWHGYFAIQLQRFFPGILHFLMRKQF